MNPYLYVLSTPPRRPSAAFGVAGLATTTSLLTRGALSAAAGAWALALRGYYTPDLMEPGEARDMLLEAAKGTPIAPPGIALKDIKPIDIAPKLNRKLYIPIRNMVDAKLRAGYGIAAIARLGLPRSADLVKLADEVLISVSMEDAQASPGAIERQMEALRASVLKLVLTSDGKSLPIITWLLGLISGAAANASRLQTTRDHQEAGTPMPGEAMQKVWDDTSLEVVQQKVEEKAKETAFDLFVPDFLKRPDATGGLALAPWVLPTAGVATAGLVFLLLRRPAAVVIAAPSPYSPGA